MDIKNKYFKYKNKYVKKNLYGGGMGIFNESTYIPNNYEPNHIYTEYTGDIMNINISHIALGNFQDTSIPWQRFHPESTHPRRSREATYIYKITINESNMTIVKREWTTNILDDIEILRIVKETLIEETNILLENFVDNINKVINYIRVYNDYIDEEFPEHHELKCKIAVIS